MNKNGPNILTILRVLLVPLFIVYYNNNNMLWALIIFVVASLTDMLDGNIARKYNLISNFGKFMDPLADKILTYTAFCLMVQDKYMPATYLIIVLAREFVVAGIRMLAAEKGTVIAADLFGKIKTVLQMIGIPMFLLTLTLANLRENGMNISEQIIYYMNMISSLIITASVVMTVISGANYVINNKEVFKDGN